MQVPENPEQVRQGPPEPIHRGDRDQIEPTPGGVLQEPVQRRTILPALRPTNGVIRVDLDYLPSGAGRNLPQFAFLTGSRGELQPIWQAYNVLVDVPVAGVTSHSTYVLLLDRRGKPRLYYSAQVTAAEVLHDLRRLMSTA